MLTNLTAFHWKGIGKKWDSKMLANLSGFQGEWGDETCCQTLLVFKGGDLKCCENLHGFEGVNEKSKIVPKTLMVLKGRG